MVSPRVAPPLGMRPMDSGRKPRGSRTANTRSRVIITKENAPSIRRSASAIASGSVCSLDCAIRCTMTSVSEVVWKMEPCAPVVRGCHCALTRLPLWASAIMPLLQSTMMGCALSSAESPVVE